MSKEASIPFSNSLCRWEGEVSRLNGAMDQSVEIMVTIAMECSNVERCLLADFTNVCRYLEVSTSVTVSHFGLLQ